MRKLMLMVLLALGGSAAGLFSPPPAAADNCVTYCTNPDPCGYVCCYKQCCGGRCVALDCAPPPPCGENN
ncbi:MAG TPA: hypothetical protein VGG03_16145 [Thermoanaerobaculia bacterium]|jgi:hypothetical protein